MDDERKYTYDERTSELRVMNDYGIQKAHARNKAIGKNTKRQS